MTLFIVFLSFQDYGKMDVNDLYEIKDDDEEKHVKVVIRNLFKVSLIVHRGR